MQYLREFISGQLRRPLTNVFFTEEWGFGPMRFLNEGSGQVEVRQTADIVFMANGTLGETPTFDVNGMTFAATPPRLGVPAPAPNVFARSNGDLVSGRVGNWRVTENFGIEGAVADGQALLRHLAFQQVRTQPLEHERARTYAVLQADAIPAIFLQMFPDRRQITDDALGQCELVFSFSPEDAESEYSFLLQNQEAWIRIDVQQNFEENISWHRDAFLDTLRFLWGDNIQPLAMFTQTSTADITDLPARTGSLKKQRCLLPAIGVYPSLGREPVELIRRAAEFFFLDGLPVIRHLKAWWSAQACYPEVQAATLRLTLENIARAINPAVDEANIVQDLAQFCEIELSPSPTEGLMQEVESFDITRTLSRSIDDQFVMREMDHLYVVISFLYQVILSRFRYVGTFAYPNVLVSQGDRQRS